MDAHFENNCISVKNIPEFDHSYTVIRTSGEKMSGWTIGCNLPIYQGMSWAKHHATKTVTPTLSNKGWRLMLSNNEDPGNLLCGWKPINTIWPTVLDGDDAAIQAWHDKVVAILDSLVIAG